MTAKKYEHHLQRMDPAHGDSWSAVSILKRNEWGEYFVVDTALSYEEAVRRVDELRKEELA